MAFLATALATFWERASADRTPIIEPIPGDSTRVLATFVYRDTAALTNVVISGGVAGWVDALTVMEERLTLLPVRFYMDVGVYETDRSANQGPGQVWPNRHFRDVLRAKGYDVDYHEFAGAHEYLNWRGTISDALMRFFSPANH